jgi:hypothetical protein
VILFTPPLSPDIAADEVGWHRRRHRAEDGDEAAAERDQQVDQNDMPAGVANDACGARALVRRFRLCAIWLYVPLAGRKPCSSMLFMSRNNCAGVAAFAGGGSFARYCGRPTNLQAELLRLCARIGYSPPRF